MKTESHVCVVKQYDRQCSLASGWELELLYWTSIIPDEFPLNIVLSYKVNGKWFPSPVALALNIATFCVCPVTAKQI